MRLPAAADEPSFAELFTPKLFTVLREGYGLSQLRADAAAGLTVAIVALPLSMAIAMACGVSPAQGLYSAIVGGFVVSALGGSRFQIGGPAGAFIVLVAATVQAHGIDGTLLATMLSGLLLAAMGLLRLGTYIKFIPYPVSVGFTGGVAVIILASQVKGLLGLVLDGPEPAELVEKLPALWRALPTADGATVAVAVATIGIVVGLKHLRPNWPGLLIAVGATTVTAAGLGMPVDTIGSAFGGIPRSLPLPAVPEIDAARVLAVLPNAIAFALLGSIESLLSAVVADGMTGRRHRSNCELVAQGVANVAAGLFGGISVTGTIARTATNVRAGAHGPVAGMLHAAFLLVFVLVAAPLAAYVPLAALAGVLAVVAWNMVERQAVVVLIRASGGDAVVLATTFLLTVFRDLTEAIVVGFAIGSVLFIHRMSTASALEFQAPLIAEDRADDADGPRRPYRAAVAADPEIVVYRFRGALFFGAASVFSSVLDRIADSHKALILDLSSVPFVDSTAANALDGLARKAERRGIRLYLAGAEPAVRLSLSRHHVGPPLVHFAASVDRARSDFRGRTSTG